MSLQSRKIDPGCVPGVDLLSADKLSAQAKSFLFSGVSALYGRKLAPSVSVVADLLSGNKKLLQ